MVLEGPDKWRCLRQRVDWRRNGRDKWRACWQAEISDGLAGINGWEDGAKPQAPALSAEPAAAGWMGQLVVLNVRNGLADRAFIQRGLLVNQAGHERGMAELVDAAR